MANKDLQLKSHQVKDAVRDTWWYEETYGFHILTATSEGVIEMNIPWNSIRAALKRKDK